MRWRIDPLDGGARTLDDRLRLAAPRLSSSLVAATLRAFPAGSRIRKAALTRALRAGFAAIGRGDYELWRLGYDPDVEFHLGRLGWQALGLPEVSRGVDNLWDFLGFMREAFGDLRFEPREIVDAGASSFACRVDFVGVGRDSGVETRQETWYVFFVERGRIVRQHSFPTESEALELLGEARAILRA